MKNSAVFHFKPFSQKQRKVLNWWTDESPVKDYDGIIADGAIRSGKSLTMSLSFVLWAMSSFNGQNFAMCGKSVGSFRRNVLFWLKLMLTGRGYTMKDKRADNLVIISRGTVENYFYIFGGRDERSQDFIQGVTLAGVFLDEVALMPESFVTQALGRCSVEGAKYWFNCNPSYPSHWFKVNWIDKHKEKRIIYLHFTMDDNLSLSKRKKEQYYRNFSGVFFDRYILGLWSLAEGIIYPMYKEAIQSPPEGVFPDKWCLSIDYGTQNAFAAILWGKYGDVWYGIKEYYYSGRATGIQKTDAEYGKDMDDFISCTDCVMETIIDPSAASFIALLRRKGGRYKVRKADNAVSDGIRETATALKNHKIYISPTMKNWRDEVAGYSWDDKCSADVPVKINDHLMDAMRYFVRTKRIGTHFDRAVPKWD